ncbi:hypothetical protein AVEN_142369-1 [Araneus ventricosus]|uniref:Uncharacterized protein n=1 Tax=Araneus ventricosus TaxID=182803 RepID=A0A4Y2KUQ5_ARAVE|nr:hypothetical protein AVEN_58469-1 [Araneus ventricosus]GBN05255.1 hypothetical protein AVEN_142369-1 [Araneus ventricosus]
MAIAYEKEMERLRKLLAEVETDEDSDFENEDNGPEDVLDFSDHESFGKHHMESEEGGDSGNENLNNSVWFSSKDGVQWGRTKFRQTIHTRCHNIVLCLPGTKGQAKDVTSPVKSWELYINDNMIQLIVDSTNIYLSRNDHQTFYVKDMHERRSSRITCFISG